MPALNRKTPLRSAVGLLATLFVCLLFPIPSLCQAADTPTANADLLWVPGLGSEEKDCHVAFRGEFELGAAAEVSFDCLGASWFVGWLDSEYFCEGPIRFVGSQPEYQTFKKSLKAGKHTMAFQVNYVGVETRMLQDMAPFLYCTVRVGEKVIEVDWKCRQLKGYESQVERINDQLAYVEWCDTRQIPAWQEKEFNATEWPVPVVVERSLGVFRPAASDNPLSIRHSLSPTESGKFVELFGYEKDNPQARFFLRDLNPATGEQDLPPSGVWRRYDLSRVRLMRPRLVLDVPAGAVVEFAYSESLNDGRVPPWITLSSGDDSCNLDHYVARGGVQEFFPLTPKGGRFVEVHVLAPPDQIRFVKEEILERCYFDAPQGKFECDDAALNKIWSIGVETLRACAEDTLIDNPTRERGQWTGDVVSSGMDINAAAYSDLRLCRRCFVHSALCAREDGMVAGQSPGQLRHLSTFAAQWLCSCVHYWELTGDIAILQDLFSAAENNISAFETHNSENGILDSAGWGFVDWGYVRNPGRSDMALNLHYLAALGDMVRWCKALGKEERTTHYQSLANSMEAIVRNYFAGEFEAGGGAWERIGYHRVTLGMQLGLFTPEQESAAVDFLKRHIMNCFPNNPSAPRLSAPDANNPQLITPYFSHYAFQELIKRGEFDFVLDQYRTCWGWAMSGGRTTWVEVFDTRWSHCHQWAGCPTWQLTRYGLGLRPRFDLGDRCYTLFLPPCSLERASGSIPLPNTEEVIQVSWSRNASGRQYQIVTPTPIRVAMVENPNDEPSEWVDVENTWQQSFVDP